MLYKVLSKTALYSNLVYISLFKQKQKVNEQCAIFFFLIQLLQGSRSQRKQSPKLLSILQALSQPKRHTLNVNITALMSSVD